MSKIQAMCYLIISDPNLSAKLQFTIEFISTLVDFIKIMRI